MSEAAAASPLERLALRLVPAHDRDALLGDLHEDGVRTASHRARAILGVGLAYQHEPYRDDRARLGILALLALGLLLLAVVPLAARGFGAVALDGRVWRAAAAFWAHGGPIAAAAVGLVVGRAPLMPTHAAAARWHVAAALAVAAGLVATSWTTGCASAALLLGATWLAASARPATLPPGAAA